MTGKGEIDSNSIDNKYKFSKLHIGIFIALFTLSLLTVFRVVPYIVTVIATIIILLIFDRKTILKIDYSLLFTFVFFFIFSGNMARIDAVRNVFSFLLEKIKEFAGK